MAGLPGYMIQKEIRSNYGNPRADGCWWGNRKLSQKPAPQSVALPLKLSRARHWQGETPSSRSTFAGEAFFIEVIHG